MANCGHCENCPMASSCHCDGERTAMVGGIFPMSDTAALGLGPMQPYGASVASAPAGAPLEPEDSAPVVNKSSTFTAWGILVIVLFCLYFIFAPISL